MLQHQALDILKMGHNVFLTGAAGSGKTHTLRAYIAWLREQNIDVAITASTGIAATHLGGVTIHAWSGLGIRDTLTEQDIDILEEKQNLWKRYESTKVLIIDDIVDSGKTMIEVFKILNEKFPNTEFKLATLFYKTTALIKPDFYIKQTDIWIEFFWEVDIQIKEER